MSDLLERIADALEANAEVNRKNAENIAILVGSREKDHENATRGSVTPCQNTSTTGPEADSKNEQRERSLALHYREHAIRDAARRFAVPLGGEKK